MVPSRVYTAAIPSGVRGVPGVRGQAQMTCARGGAGRRRSGAFRRAERPLKQLFRVFILVPDGIAQRLSENGVRECLVLRYSACAALLKVAKLEGAQLRAGQTLPSHCCPAAASTPLY
jgi:hypothetical protein